MPFPTEFPQAALTTIIANLTDKSNDSLRVLVEAGYDVLGYGLDVGLPDDGAPLAMKATSQPLSREAQLEVLQQAQKSAAAPKAVAIDWGLFVQVVMSLITQWLSGQR